MNNADPLSSLVNEVYTHEALNNKFYTQWMISKLSLEKIAIFARNYWELTFRFPEALASLISNFEDLELRTEYSKTLFSEMGNGNPKAVHYVLFENFCNDLAQHMGQPGYLCIDNLKKNITLLPETVAVVKGQRVLYSQNPAIATGAQLAMEWQAYTMIRQLYDGVRNYIDLWPNQDSFHESCEFFYAHIGSAEKEHKIEALNAAYKILKNGGDLLDMKHGFNHHLKLLANFWNAVSQ